MFSSIRKKFRKRKRESFFVNRINRSYAKLSDKKELSKSQEKEIQDYYLEKLGRNVPTDWHRYFYSRTGEFTKYYIPDCVYKMDLVGRCNKFPFRDAYSDKNLQDALFPEARQPKTYLRNINGYFYSDGKAISESEALDLCKDLGPVIIKPSLERHGDGVQRVVLHDGKVESKEKSVASLFSDYRENYLIQEVLMQHPGMASLNPTSINTIRAMTFRSGMEILVLYTVVRIGRSGKVIDNESAGGISARINFDGRIARYAFGAPGDDKIEKTDSGVVLDGFEVPGYQKAVEFVKKLHYNLPFFNLVGWDLCIGVDGEPILIEWNATPELSQSANGPAFGDYTDRVLSELKNKKNTRK